MKISILIANYNTENFIYECILSALNQNFSGVNYELVVCDDCSTDKSMTIINQFCKLPNVKIFQNEVNCGVGFTKKKLVELCDGDWFVFLDSDDLFKANCIETFVEILRKINQNDFSVLYGDSDYIDINGKLNYWNRSKQLEGSLLKNKFKYPIFHPILYNRKLYNQTDGIDIRLKSADDFDLWYKMEEVGNFLFLPYVMYTYRINMNGVSQIGMNYKKWFEVMLEHAVTSSDAARRRNLDQRAELNEFAEIMFLKKLKNKENKNTIHYFKRIILSFFQRRRFD